MRLGCALLAACLAGPALAQTDGDRQFEAGRSADLQNWQWRAQRGAQPSDAERAVQGVVDAAAQRDCKGAAPRLNAGVAKGYPEVIVLAGAMYEDGVCLKPNWGRAADLYQRAAAAGHPGAAARLAAGYAAPSGGRDLAAALWWAVRAKTALPVACTQVAPLADDADRFVAALKGWPAGQLNACVYAAAVMASLQSELASPTLAAAYGQQGRIRLAFAPAEGRIDISDELTALPGTQSVGDSAARDALVAFVRGVKDRALARYEKPAGIASGWRVETDREYKAVR